MMIDNGQFCERCQVNFKYQYLYDDHQCTPLDQNHDSLYIKFEQLTGLLDSALYWIDITSTDARKPVEDAVKLVDIIRKMVIK